jgi:hypothetical protein
MPTQAAGILFADAFAAAFAGCFLTEFRLPL